ncbi:hypothetical protein SEVIR_1G220700v4 [Setaria viridis]|uniref:Uncharacterized protein n=1 Tax=Setaria viridis TaxID=4556 RepID=A0A4V6DD52_SETVI|nr:uncharacterized protein LOC117835924 [Setaria viridis]TKW40056.1 hypothetical protein SEVIR_1G220700v2 [Setaria viridis]
MTLKDIGKCTEIYYKDPVLKDRQWSAYIDRSPGQDSYSLECFNACVSGCGFRFEVPTEKVEEIKPNRPSKPSPPPEVKRTTSPLDSTVGSCVDVQMSPI